MISRIIITTLAAVVILSVLYNLWAVSVDFYHRYDAPTPSVITVETTPVSIEKTPSTELAATNTSATVTVTSNTTDEEIVNSVKPATGQALVSMVKPSKNLLLLGKVGAGWKSNSWNVTLSEKKNSLSVLYKAPWAALSLFTSTFDLLKYNSIEVTFAQGVSVDVIKQLHLSLYQGSEKIGSVALMNYVEQNGGATMVRVPFTDMDLTNSEISDVVIESENTAMVSFSQIIFSGNVPPSRKQVVAPAAVIPVSQPTQTPTPAPTPAPVQPPAPVVVSNPTVFPQVYFAGLQNGWNYRSRAVDVDLMNEERSITGKAIMLHFNTSTSSFAFVHKDGVVTKDFKAMHIRVYGGITDHEWQQLTVTLYDGEGKKLATKDIAAFSANGQLKMQQWNDYVLPLAAFGAENTIIKTIDIENATVTQEGDHMWIDNIEFLQDL